MVSTYSIDFASNSRISDNTPAWQGVCDADVVSWPTADPFLLAISVFCTAAHGNCASEVKLQFQRDGGAWTDVGDAGVGEQIDAIAGLNDPGDSGCQAHASTTLVGTPPDISESISAGNYEQLTFSLDPGFAFGGSQYTFRLWDTGDASAVPGTCAAQLTILQVDASENLGASFTVRKSGSQNLPGEFVARRDGSQDLKAGFNILGTVDDSEDFPGEFVVRKAGSQELLGELVVRRSTSEELLGELVVRRSTSEELLGGFVSRQAGSANLLGGFIVRQAASQELLGEFTSRQAGSQELLGELVVRHPGSEDLAAGFEVRQWREELAAGFRVRCPPLMGENLQHKMWYAAPYYWRSRYDPTGDELIFEYISEAGLAGNSWAKNANASIDASGFTGSKADFAITHFHNGENTTIIYSDGVDAWVAESDQASALGWAWENLTKVFDGTAPDWYRSVNIGIDQQAAGIIWVTAVFYDQSEGKQWVRTREQSVSGDITGWEAAVDVSNVDNTATILGQACRSMGAVNGDDMIFVYKEQPALRSRYYDGDWDDVIETIDATTHADAFQWNWDFEHMSVAGSNEAHILYDDADHSVQWMERAAGAAAVWGNKEQIGAVHAGEHSGFAIIEHGTEWCWAIWGEEETINAEYRVHQPAHTWWPPLVNDPETFEMDTSPPAVVTTTTVAQISAPDNIPAGAPLPITWIGKATGQCDPGWGILVPDARQDLAAGFIVRQPASQDLAASFDAQATQSLLGGFVSRQAGSQDLPAGFNIRRDGSQELLAELIVRQAGSANLLGGFVSRQAGSQDLAASFDGQVSLNLPGELIVRQAPSEDLLGELVVRHPGSQNLLGGFIVRQAASQDLAASFEGQATQSLLGEFVVRHPGSEDLPAEFVARQSGSQDLAASFEGQVRLNFPAEFVVRQSGSQNLAAELVVQSALSSDSEELAAEFEVGQGSADLAAKFEAGAVFDSSQELLAGLIVGQDSEDLLGELVSRQAASQALPAGFTVGQGTGDLPGGFVVYRYYGNEFLATSALNQNITVVGRKVAYRFRAQDSKTVKEVAVRHGSGSGHTYKFDVGIQGDAGGRPDGVWINNCEVEWDQGGAPAGQGWNWHVLSANVALTKGTIYHAVIEATELTNTFNVRGSTPENRMYVNRFVTSGDTVGSASQVYDPQLDAEYYNGAAWSSLTSNVTFALKYTDDEVIGQPYDNDWANSRVYLGNSQYQTIVQDRTVTIKSIGVYTKKSNNPVEDLIVELRLGGVVQRSITIPIGEVGASFAWEEKSITPFTLKRGVTYQLWWTCTGGDGANVYDVIRPWNEESPPSVFHDYTWGGATSTYNIPATWPGHDMTFRFAQTSDRSWEDVAASFTVLQGAEDLPAGFMIRQVASEDLLGEIVIRHSDSEELPAELAVRRSASQELAAGFDTQRILDLPAGFLITQVGSQELAAGFYVRRSASVELKMGFWVNWYSADLPANIYVRPRASRATDFEVKDNTRGLTVRDADRSMTVTPRRKMRVR